MPRGPVETEMVKPEPLRFVREPCVFTKGMAGLSLHPASVLSYQRWENKQFCEPPDGLCLTVFQEGESSLAKRLGMSAQALRGPSLPPGEVQQQGPHVLEQLPTLVSDAMRPLRSVAQGHPVPHDQSW